MGGVVVAPHSDNWPGWVAATLRFGGWAAGLSRYFRAVATRCDEQPLHPCGISRFPGAEPRWLKNTTFGWVQGVLQPPLPGASASPGYLAGLTPTQWCRGAST